MLQKFFSTASILVCFFVIAFLATQISFLKYKNMHRNSLVALVINAKVPPQLVNTTASLVICYKNACNCSTPVADQQQLARALLLFRNSSVP